MNRWVTRSWVARSGVFALGALWMGLGLLACVLNPQPLPPDQPDSAALGTATPDSGHYGRDSSFGDSAKSNGPDAGLPSPEAGGGGGGDTGVDGEPLEGGDAALDGASDGGDGGSLDGSSDADSAS
jgi:hypothetical protein